MSRCFLDGCFLYIIVLQWDLVCENKELSYLANSVLYIGMALGAGTLMAVSDRFVAYVFIVENHSTLYSCTRCLFIIRADLPRAVN